MKLVHDSSSRDGELPAAESCGIDDEEISWILPKSLQISLNLLFSHSRLEYKYMKLVHDSSSRDGELPAAESCGIGDEDDEIS